jgi:hypothetical protein
VSGPTIGGAVTRVEPGQWVELKNQTYGKIIVRIDRIDAVPRQASGAMSENRLYVIYALPRRDRLTESPAR